MTKLSLIKNCSIIAVSICILALSGCGKPEIRTKKTDPVFFPPAPNTPRIQFLTSFNSADDFAKKKPGFLEDYILGESKIAVETILQPFGVAVYDNKIYVCDIGRGNIKVIDIARGTFDVLKTGRTLQQPVNIFIETNGTKYIADSRVGAIIVYNKNDKLIGYLGKRYNIKPMDVVVEGNNVYLTDANNNQVLVLDKKTGEQIKTIGRNLTDRENWEPDEFGFISCLALDSKQNVCVTDKIKGRVTVFDSAGKFTKFVGKTGSLPDSIVRGKGLTFDREDRLWVIDAGPANAAKVFRNSDGRILMYFGLLGKNPGQMYMPADICIDYEHVELFRKYAVEGAELECIIFVTNQYGPNKVSVYGFGKFPDKYKLEGVITEPAEEVSE